MFPRVIQVFDMNIAVQQKREGKQVPAASLLLRQIERDLTCILERIGITSLCTVIVKGVDVKKE